MKYLKNNLFKGNEIEVKKLEEIIYNLENKRIYIIAPLDEKPIMPKVVWKYKTYEQVSLHRVVDLATNACNNWNNGFPGTSFILTRCIFENCAYIYDLYFQTKRFIEEKKFSDCDELIMKITFGSRVKGVDMPEMPNVLTSIDKLNKVIPQFRNHFDHMCDLTHPNYLGMFNLYCKDLQNDFISHISKGNGVNQGNFNIFVISLLAVLNTFLAYFHKLQSIYPSLTELSNEDYKSMKSDKH